MEGTTTSDEQTASTDQKISASLASQSWSLLQNSQREVALLDTQQRQEQQDQQQQQQRRQEKHELELIQEPEENNLDSALPVHGLAQGLSTKPDMHSDKEKSSDEDESLERAQIARDLAETYDSDSSSSFNDSQNDSDESSGISAPNSPHTGHRTAVSSESASNVASILNDMSLRHSASQSVSAPTSEPTSPSHKVALSSSSPENANGVASETTGTVQESSVILLTSEQSDMKTMDRAESTSSESGDAVSTGDSSTQTSDRSEIEDCGCTAADDFPCPEKMSAEGEEPELEGQVKEVKQAILSSEDELSDSSPRKEKEEREEKAPKVSAWSRACASLQKPYLQSDVGSRSLSRDNSSSLSAMMKGMVLGIILGYLVNHAINKNRRIAMRELLEQRDREIQRLVSLVDKYTQIPMIRVVMKRGRR
jgi:hypothetical protein